MRTITDGVFAGENVVNTFEINSRTDSALPERFEVYAPPSQKIFGIVRLLIGVALGCAAFSLAYCGTENTGARALYYYAVLLFMVFCSAYLAAEAIWFDIGRTIIVDGRYLKVGRNSCSLDCIAKVKRLEEEPRRGLVTSIFSHFGTPRYEICDCWGKRVCCCRENYINFDLLHRWLLQKDCVVK